MIFIFNINYSQAALGSIPLDLARESGNKQFIEYGETVTFLKF